MTYFTMSNPVHVTPISKPVQLGIAEPLSTQPEIFVAPLTIHIRKRANGYRYLFLTNEGDWSYETARTFKSIAHADQALRQLKSRYNVEINASKIEERFLRDVTIVDTLEGLLTDPKSRNCKMSLVHFLKNLFK